MADGSTGLMSYPAVVTTGRVWRAGRDGGTRRPGDRFSIPSDMPTTSLFSSQAVVRMLLSKVYRTRFLGHKFGLRGLA